MDNALANPRRTKIDAWPEWRPAEPDSERPAEADVSEDELAAH
ncbi:MULTISPECIES: hypothetical protein [Actinomadura]|jgi:hypothetical protein|uniref:Uncharacterized protein n=1 Tax=Actinomadura citrea TaxID=46158 RepID=A0A7Y9GHE4_9ACTN|nr:hypothetical protein [Actinomadura citrea]NYE16573.1 hypothetical protein [Actinomadura citrea]GGT56575.1 hypothetical protein GCM10010177_10840 [Actinomadura citrea]